LREHNQQRRPDPGKQRLLMIDVRERRREQRHGTEKIRRVADGEGIGTIGSKQRDEGAPANTECLERTCVAKDRATQRAASNVSMEITQYRFIRPYAQLFE
jgi:hypothetical protein